MMSTATDILPDNVYLALFDMDGCVLRGKKNNNEKFYDWFVRQNKSLLNSILEKIKNKKYNKVIVGAFSNRGDISTDEFNATKNDTHTSEIVLAAIQRYLAIQLSDPTIKVVIDPLRPEDLYSREEAGTSLVKQIKKKYKNTPIEEKKALFDENKIGKVYLFSHRTKKYHPTANIDTDIFDNNKNILSMLHLFYGEPNTTNPMKQEANDSKLSTTSTFVAFTSQQPLGLAKKLLPRNVSISLHHFNGTLTPLEATPITGDCDVDCNYEWAMRFWATQTPVSENPYLKAVKTTHPAPKNLEELLAYHSKNLYDFNLQIKSEKISNQDKLHLLLDFIKSLPPAEQQCTLGRTANYLNVSSLVQMGLPADIFPHFEEKAIENNLTKHWQSIEKEFADTDREEQEKEIEMTKRCILQTLFMIAASTYWDTRQSSTLLNQPPVPTFIKALRDKINIALNMPDQDLHSSNIVKFTKNIKQKLKTFSPKKPASLSSCMPKLNEDTLQNLIDEEMKTPGSLLPEIDLNSIIVKTQEDETVYQKTDSFLYNLDLTKKLMNDFRVIHTTSIKNLLDPEKSKKLLQSNQLVNHPDNILSALRNILDGTTDGLQALNGYTSPSSTTNLDKKNNSKKIN